MISDVNWYNDDFGQFLSEPRFNHVNTYADEMFLQYNNGGVSHTEAAMRISPLYTIVLEHIRELV